MYRERYPFTMVFPNMFARNHPYNTEENVLIRQANSYWDPGLYIVKVIADDSLFQKNFYDIVAVKNCKYVCPQRVRALVFHCLNVLWL